MRESISVYGSGGFTSYTTAQLQHQLGGWVGRGINRAKVKVGRDPDGERLRLAHEAAGPNAETFRRLSLLNRRRPTAHA